MSSTRTLKAFRLNEFGRLDNPLLRQGSPAFYRRLVVSWLVRVSVLESVSAERSSGHRIDE
jgi:hypothetical protein